MAETPGSFSWQMGRRVKTGAGELTGGEGVPQPPGLSTGAMVMPAVLPFCWQTLLSTSSCQVLCQALTQQAARQSRPLHEEGDERSQLPGI